MGKGDVDREYARAVDMLRKHRLNVHVPLLRHRPRGRGGNQGYTVGALMLVFFASRLGRVADKSELVAFLRRHRCRTHDPQPRHMGMQLGLNFLVAGCWHPQLKRVLKRGEYCLLDLSRTHPSKASGVNHRSRSGLATLDFARLKADYGNRCACCGSVEGQPHLKNALLITSLERGHLDPRQPLSGANCIPICRMCNMVYKDNAVLSRRGFVVSWLKRASQSLASLEGIAERDASSTLVLPPHKDSSPLPSSSVCIKWVRSLLRTVSSYIAAPWKQQQQQQQQQPPRERRAIRRSSVFFGAGPMTLFGDDDE